MNENRNLLLLVLSRVALFYFRRPRGWKNLNEKIIVTYRGFLSYAFLPTFDFLCLSFYGLFYNATRNDQISCNRRTERMEAFRLVASLRDGATLTGVQKRTVRFNDSENDD